MQVSATTDPPAATGADTIAVGAFEDEAVAHDVEGGALQGLLDSGEAKPSFKHLALVHAEGRRWLLAGLGAREQFDAERARTVAGAVHGRSRELGTAKLCWELPHDVSEEVTGALVQGTELAAYRFDRYKDQANDQPPALEELIVSAHHDVGDVVAFDTGGISIKPSAKMHEMKYDMSGGAAVLEATGAVARLGLPVSLVSVVGATENMPSGRSVKPGDIVRAMNGTTIEVNNTDAEGRLVLADCLAYALEQGAERLVDLATLTGAIIIALGSTYAGVMGNDDDWTEQLLRAGERSGEALWRLPLHEEYAELVKGQFADLNNTPEARKAGSIVGAECLQRFVADAPWAHVDIAGTAWD